MKNNRKINFIIVVFMVILLFSPLFPVPELQSPYFSALANSMHFLIMAAATWILLRKSSTKTRIVLSILLPAVAAILVEFFQMLIPDRHFGIDDVIRGLMGSFTVLLLVKFRKNCFSFVLIVLMILWSWGYDLISTKVRLDLMQSRFPIIDDIGAPAYTNAWQSKEGAKISRDQDRIIVEVPADAKWPQMESRIIPGDWNGYDSMIILVKADYKLQLGSRIQCSKGRYYYKFEIDDNLSRVSIPLSSYQNGNINFSPLWKVNSLNFFVSELPRHNRIIFFRISLK